MKKWDHYCMRLFFFGCFLLFSAQIYAADAFRLYDPERFDLDLAIDYNKTDSNFGSNGSRESLSSGNYLSALDITAQGRYVINPQTSIGGGLQITNSESSDLNFVRRNSSISYFNIETDYLFKKQNGIIVFGELILRYPLEKIESYTDAVSNSDGAIELKPQLTVVLLKSGYSPYASVGLNYRTEGLATLVTYVVGTELEFERIGLGGNINGFLTLLGDQKSEVERNTINNRVNGGSFKFNSYNPAIFAFDAYLKYYLTKDFIMKAHVGYPVIGYNTSAGLNLGFGITWGFGGSDPNSFSKPTPAPQIARPPEPPVHSQPIQLPIQPKAVQSAPTQQQQNPVVKPVYKPLPKPPQQPKPKPLPVPPIVKLPKSTQTSQTKPKSKPINSDTSYIKQIEGSPNSLEKATESEQPVGDMPQAPPEYGIKLKKVKKSKKK